MTEQRYDPVAQMLHWLTLIAVIAAYAIGLYREGLPKTDFRAALMSLHMSVGLLVMALTIARLTWKVYSPNPASAVPSKGARVMAKLGHFALYATLLLIPMIGVAAAWAKGRDLSFFGLFPVPALFPPQKAWVSPLEKSHEVTAHAMMALAGLHALAALAHHYILKDGTLMRMLPFSGRLSLARHH